MDQDAFREAMREIGRRGGLARAKSMNADQRRKSALKASRAAAAARTRRRLEKAVATITEGTKHLEKTSAKRAKQKKESK